MTRPIAGPWERDADGGAGRLLASDDRRPVAVAWYEKADRKYRWALFPSSHEHVIRVVEGSAPTLEAATIACDAGARFNASRLDWTLPDTVTAPPLAQMAEQSQAPSTRAALAVACSTCGSQIGERCETPLGNKCTPHRERRRAAKPAVPAPVALDPVAVARAALEAAAVQVEAGRWAAPFDAPSMFANGALGTAAKSIRAIDPAAIVAAMRKGE